MEPALDQVQQVAGDVAAVGAVEGRLVVVEHGFEDRIDLLMRHLEIQEEVDHPRRGPHAALVLEGVALQHREEYGHREGDLRHPQAAAQAAHLFDHGLVRLRLTSFHGLVVQVLQEVLPRRLDVRGVAVVGEVEDLQADIIVTAGVGILVEELSGY